MGIQTTIHDVVFSGHGGIYAPAIMPVTKVPPGVEFWLLARPGVSLLNHVGWMLETGEKIEGLYIRKVGKYTWRPEQPTIYPHGAELPDLTLKFGDFVQKNKSTVPHIITTAEETHLQDLWPHIDPFRTAALKAGRTLRVFWGACSEIENQTEGWNMGATNHYSVQHLIPE